MGKRSLELNQEEEDDDYDESEEEDENHEQVDTEDDGYDDDDDGAEEVEDEEAPKDRRKRVFIRSLPEVVSYNTLCCQVDECCLDLRVAKRYHRRHKVCERHAKAAVVLVDGIEQRFCQQCSRFHEISWFDDTKRSCRERLAGHNERRRRSNPDLQAETGQNPSICKMNGSSLKPAAQPDCRDLTCQRSSSTKHFRIR
ncbi:hypothetical protein F0562_006804 [Nyssa sinensis]|uniref:SBP-type domain-containing protein n=1 Tax=Nyssa sinensis TaxID=561372 RepID=A0A5J5AP17_9ASTE|nr:hypothetical protein F0562_006804 [Nyssa sinensis]